MRFLQRILPFMIGVCALSAFAQPNPSRLPIPAKIVAVYYQPFDSMETWKARGVNMFIGIPVGPGHPAALAYVQKAHSLGICVAGKPPQADVTELVDEPDGVGNVTPDQIAAIYKAATAADPSKPVFLNFDGERMRWLSLDVYKAYVAAVTPKISAGKTLFAVDFYPFNLGHAGDEGMDLLASRCDALKALVGNQQWITFIETCDQRIYNQKWANDATWGEPPAAYMHGPSPDQFDQEVGVIQQHGASGICYFTTVPDGSLGWPQSFDGTEPAVVVRMVWVSFRITNVPPVMAIPPPQFPQLSTRICIEENLTPVKTPNYRWQDDGKHTDPDKNGQPLWIRNNDCYKLGASLGYEHYFGAYAGTFNRSPWWSGRASLDEFNRLGFSGAEGNNCDPITVEAAMAIGKLAANPDWFKGQSNHRTPILVDLENEKTMIFTAADTAADRMAKIQRWRNTAQWFRTGAGANSRDEQEVWFYGQFPFYTQPVTNTTPECDAAMASFQELWSAPCFFHYWWDLRTDQPNRWLSEFASINGQIRKYNPYGNRIVVMCPFDNVYWPTNARPGVAVRAGQPVPFDQWCIAVDRAVLEKYTILVWTGNGLVDGVRPHLTYLAQYGLTPRNEARKWLEKYKNN